MVTCLGVYFGSLCLALLTTPVVICVAQHLKAFDRPGVRTVHTRPIPRIGGVAIFVSAICPIVATLMLDNKVGQTFYRVTLQLGPLLAAATLVFVIGLVDDLRGLPAKVKLLTEITGASLLCYAGIRVSAVDITETFRLELGLLSCPLTVLWIVGITNAVNLSDGLDGLAAGVSAVACAAIAVFAIHSRNLVMAILMLALLGDLTGFLFYNFNPAKVFMGDCGSLFLGFMIASASVMCSMKSCALVGLALPMLALGIPIFDTLFAILRRFLERRSLFAPDRRHFHHRLVDMGLRQRHAVLLVYIATCVATGLGLFMMVARDTASLVIFGCILLLLLLLFHAVGEVRLKAMLATLQGKYALAREAKHFRQTFEDLQLYFRRTRTSGEWWPAVCEAGRRFDFAWISLTSIERGGRVDTRVWRGTNTVPDAASIVTTRFSLSAANTENLLEFEVAIVANGSLESAGRRGTLFSRLIDEESSALREAFARPIIREMSH